jgi:hypothetical protein
MPRRVIVRRIPALSSLPSGSTESSGNHQKTELPITNTRWKIPDFRQAVLLGGFSELKIGD